MLKKNRNNKGFTLIELLAVIVILGVLMIIAIPMVSKYIKQSRQNAFIDTAKAYIQSARYAYFNGDLTCSGDLDSGDGTTVYITFENVEVDKSNHMSPFNKQINEKSSYILISSDSSGKYTYSVAMVDKGGNGFSPAVEESSLKKGTVDNGKDTEANATQPTLPGGVTATACTKLSS